MSRRACWPRFALGVAGALIVLVPLAHAHELEPALLSVHERGPSEYDVFFRVPARIGGGAPVPVFPAGSVRRPLREPGREGDSWVERFRLEVPGGLGGQLLRLEGDGGVREEALVRIETRAGVATGRLLPGGPGFAVPRTPSRIDVLQTYVGLGVEHILLGFDHLLFVFALVLLAPSLGALVGTVTGFTLAHSVTLACSALGWITLPGPPIEASIALSIVFVARELWLREHAAAPLPAPRLWAVAFGFGLLHGLGFAGALSEIGLPQGDIPLALLGFNGGVELGQLAFVCAVLIAARGVPQRVRARAQQWRVAAYAIGSIAAFFLIERVAAMLA